MRSLLFQVLAVTAINLKSLPQRRWLSLSTVIAVGARGDGAAGISGDGERLPENHGRLRRG